MSSQTLTRGHTFFYYSATVSAWAPLAAILFQFFIAQASPPPPSIRSFVILLPCIITLFGFICALTALFGILVHKTRGILFRTIMGICIPLALVALAIPTFLRAKERSLRQQAQPIAPSNPKPTARDR